MSETARDLAANAGLRMIGAALPMFASNILPIHPVALGAGVASALLGSDVGQDITKIALPHSTPIQKIHDAVGEYLNKPEHSTMKHFVDVMTPIAVVGGTQLAIGLANTPHTIEAALHGDIAAIGGVVAGMIGIAEVGSRAIRFVKNNAPKLTPFIEELDNVLDVFRNGGTNTYEYRLLKKEVIKDQIELNNIAAKERRKKKSFTP